MERLSRRVKAIGLQVAVNSSSTRPPPGRYVSIRLAGGEAECFRGVQDESEVARPVRRDHRRLRRKRHSASECYRAVAVSLDGRAHMGVLPRSARVRGEISSAPPRAGHIRNEAAQLWQNHQHRQRGRGPGHSRTRQLHFGKGRPARAYSVPGVRTRLPRHHSRSRYSGSDSDGTTRSLHARGSMSASRKVPVLRMGVPQDVARESLSPRAPQPALSPGRSLP